MIVTRRYGLIAEPRQHDHKSRQVAALRTQAVAEPGAHARQPRLRPARLHESHRWIVIDRLGMDRADDAHLIGTRPQVRQQLAHLLARSAMPDKAKRRPRRLKTPLIARHQRDALRAEYGRRHVLPVALSQRRLVVEQIDVRRPARHEQIDDVLRPRREMRAPQNPGDTHRLCRRRPAEQCRNRGHPQAGAGVGQETAASEEMLHCWYDHWRMSFRLAASFVTNAACSAEASP